MALKLRFKSLLCFGFSVLVLRFAKLYFYFDIVTVAGVIYILKNGGI